MLRVLAFSLLFALGCASSGSASRAPGPEAEDRPLFAYVLLPVSKAPDVNAIIKAYVDFSGERNLLRPGEKDEVKDVAAVSVGDEGFAMIGLIRMPVPKGEAEANHAHSVSYFFAEKGEELGAHAAHFVVMFHDVPGRTRKQQLVRFTHIVAAVAQSSGANGIYWGEASVTHRARFFIDQARKRDLSTMPLVWTGVDVVRLEDGRVSLLSLGLQDQLGVKDLRVTAPAAKPGEAIADFYDLVMYAVSRGAEVPHGDTVGRTADEKLRVRHETSPLDPTRTVWRVDFPD